MIRKVAFLLVIAFAALALMQCESLRGPKSYALLTVRHDETRIQFVTVMQVYGETECRAALAQFRKEFFKEKESREWRETESSCQETLEPIYQRVMNKEKFHATYIVLSPKDTWEYEARVVMFGVPSSQAQEVCEKMAKDMEKELEAKTECMQGTIG